MSALHSKVSPQTMAQAKRLVAYLNSVSSEHDQPDDFRGRRIDADETAMLALALEQMRAKVYEEDFPALKAREIIPVESDIDPGAETFSYEETQEVGSVKVISDDAAADDPPSVEVGSTKVTHSVVTLGGMFTYTIQDLKRAAFSGRPLQTRKATALRRIYERGIDRIAALGAPDDGIPYGLLNRDVGTTAGTLRGTAMTTAAWDGSPVAADMVADANKGVAEFIADSEETQEPDTLVLPTLQYLRFHHTYTTDGSPESAAQRFLKSNGFVKRIVPWNLLKDVYHVDGTNDSRGMLIRTDADVFSMVVPEEFNVLAPQPQNYAFKVLARGRFAGTCIYRPLGLRYLTGFSNA